MRLGVLLGVFGSWVLLGCASHSGNGTLVGETCKQSSECGVAGICVRSGKNGLCALPCASAGDLEDCPLGTYCDRIVVNADAAVTSELTACFPACTDSSMCASGFACKSLVSGPGKACVPR